MVKLLENTFRAVNIGLVNEIAIIADKLNLDVEIIEAAASKPFGFMPFYPGPGLRTLHTHRPPLSQLEASIAQL